MVSLIEEQLERAAVASTVARRRPCARLVRDP